MYETVYLARETLFIFVLSNHTTVALLKGH